MVIHKLKQFENFIASRSDLWMRAAIALVYIWFGAVKFFPGNPAASLIAATLPIVPEDILVPVFGVAEILIGIGFLIPKLTKIVIPVFFLHMLGAFMPFIFVSSQVFVHFPWMLSLEGQYIFKNIVLISAALVIWKEYRARAKKQ